MELEIEGTATAAICATDITEGTVLPLPEFPSAGSQSPASHEAGPEEPASSRALSAQRSRQRISSPCAFCFGLLVAPIVLAFLCLLFMDERAVGPLLILTCQVLLARFLVWLDRPPHRLPDVSLQGAVLTDPERGRPPSIADRWRIHCRESHRQRFRSYVLWSIQYVLMDAAALCVLSALMLDSEISASHDERVQPPTAVLSESGVVWLADDDPSHASEWPGNPHSMLKPKPQDFPEVVVNIGFIRDSGGRQLEGPYSFYRGETYPPGSMPQLLTVIERDLEHRDAVPGRTVLVLRADETALAGLVLDTMYAARAAGFEWIVLRYAQRLPDPKE